VFGSILHRMILWELVKVFVLSLVGLTGIFVLGGIVAEASREGLGPWQILALVPLVIPSSLPYTIPATTLFATCVVYGRLANDNEITAIKAAGISMLKVVGPCVVLGVVMSGITLGLYYRLIPYTTQLMRTLVLSDIEEFLYAQLKKDNELKLPGYSISVRRVQGRHLQDATFRRRSPKGDNFDIVAQARDAELRVDLKKREVLVLMRQGIACKDGDANAHFDSYPIRVPLAPLEENRKNSPRMLAWQQILKRIQELTQEEDQLAARIALTMSQLLLVTPPNELSEHLMHLQNEKRQAEQRVRALQTELNYRPALSFGCLFFVLIGCPVGIWFSRSDYLSAFISCFLPITFVYYPLLLCTTNLAKDGKLHPALALWSTNVLLAVIALLLFRRLLRN
jgi:lipopolysaccharide export system permease protein